MALRASWKGVLKLAEMTCPVALFTAVSTSERVAFQTLNRKTGHTVHRQFIDSEIGKPVEAADQVKGYETSDGEYILLEPEEIAAAIPDSDKTLTIAAFVACAEVDDIYFDRPYYLAPSSPAAIEAFALLREGMRALKSAAIARAVLFRRMRSVLIRPHDQGMVATTLKFDYEVRSAQDAFSDIPSAKVDAEMLDLAQHIIKTKKGRFDPKGFDDRYETALADLVKAKLAGKPIPRPEPAAPGKVIDLMDALRQSAQQKGGPERKPKAASPSKRRAG